MVRGLATLFLALGLLVGACSGESAKPVVGSPAPDFTLRDLGGAEHRLGALKGKVVFLNLWATWCPPCRHEVPSMVRLYGQLRDRGLEILAVSEDQDREALRQFMQTYGMTFPVPVDENKRVYNLYRATGIPETHLIDRNGVLVRTWIGPFDWTAPDVVAQVTDLLAR